MNFSDIGIGNRLVELGYHFDVNRFFGHDISEKV